MKLIEQMVAVIVFIFTFSVYAQSLNYVETSNGSASKDKSLFVVVGDFDDVIKASRKDIRGNNARKILKSQFNALEKISQRSNPLGKVTCIIDPKHRLKKSVQESCRLLLN